jgi:hypothetical protein
VPKCARGLGDDLPLAVVGHEADLGMLAPAVVGRADLPRRFTGQTFLCICLSLSLASCDSGTYGDRHHRFVDLASFTNLASLADFASLEVALTLTLMSPSSTPLTSSSPSSPLEVVVPVPVPLSSSLVGRASFNSNSPPPWWAGSVADEEDGLLQLQLLHEPRLNLGLLDLGLLQLLLEVLNVVEEVATEHLQLELLQGLVLDSHDSQESEYRLEYGDEGNLCMVVGVVGAITRGVNISIEHHDELTFKVGLHFLYAFVARARFFFF